jgi:hypothetical protein
VLRYFLCCEHVANTYRYHTCGKRYTDRISTYIYTYIYKVNRSCNELVEVGK